MKFYLYSLIFVVSGCVNTNEISNKRDNFLIEEEFFSNGSLKYQLSYKDDKLHGDTTSWDINGNILSRVQYRNGLIHGTWKTFYETGKLKSTTNYSYGEKHGEEVWFHPDGSVQSKISYIKGKISSDIIRWDQNGDRIK